jgi:5-methylcytosine-specific restriction endonuclease McrA
VRPAALIALMLLLTACREEAERKVLRITERAQAPNPNAGLSSEPFLADVARVEATGFSGRPRFFVVARTPAIQTYPCSTCHTVPIERMRGSAGSPKRAHWDVTLRHAPPAVMRCGTCHTPDTPGTLHMLERTKVDLDHSYQVCAQCHARPADDWASGAHGKRVGGWAPPRVVLACSQCHDPHQPRWDTRWPAVAGRTE